jgi:hypothetical protein
MKEYIDREALLNRLEESSDTWWKGLGRSWWAHSVILKDNFVSLIREAPTADVVAVVRCKDCLHRGPIKNNSMICLITGDYVPKDHFCSCGARKGQKENV